jgi:SAM-dependent methyltransferase
MLPPMTERPNAPSPVCPVCGAVGMISTVQRVVLPAMQNYVFQNRGAALSSPSGRFELGICKTCGFAANLAFDPAIPTYDQIYDNAVPSAVFKRYYREIAQYLYETYPLSGGLVVDIGCGKGEFLAGLCDAFPDLRGLGVDPSCRAGVSHDGRMRLVNDIFRPGLIAERPALVVCRHVVEHIADPVGFLKAAKAGLADYPGVPFFVEVPDLDWIIGANAFWDFCYEHCNYFTIPSMSRAIAQAGFRLTAARRAFGDQYLWFECVNEAPLDLPKPQPAIAERLIAYSLSETALIERMIALIERLKAEGSVIAVWGMATKGVMFSMLVDRDGSRIDWCIDVNPNKQSSFTPLSGRQIQAPAALAREPEREIVILVMNDNYAAEIKAQCLDLALSRPPRFLDAAGRPL